MKTKEKQKTYNKLTTEHLALENSFGTIYEDPEVLINCTVGIKDSTYGWFEYYDEKTGGNEWHAEGGLWFEGKTVVDYDGVFALTQGVIDLLKENGYDTSEVEI